MIEVCYVGDVPLSHPSGEWKPGETKMFSRVVATALVRERADFVLAQRATGAPKRKKSRHGGESR